MSRPKGSTLTEEHKRKIGQGNKGKIVSNEARQKMSLAKLGKPLIRTEEGKKSFLEKMSGQKNHKWIKDRTKLKRISSQGERRTSIYFEWRKQVWKRDNWKCKINNLECKGKLETHHILNWIDFPELRYDINNGITLCHVHHPKKWEEEKRLSPYFMELVSASKEKND